MLPRTILVGVSLGGDSIQEFELTPTDERVLNQALWLAAEVGASVRLHHTIDWIAGDSGSVVTALLDAATERAHRILAGVANDVSKDGITISTSVSVGTPWAELLRVGREVGAELIAVGPHVRPSGLDGIFHGSTAKRLIRKCEIPLWIIADDGPMGVRHVATAVDLTPVSERLVAFSNALGAQTGAEKTLLHCLSFPSDIVLHRLPDAADAVAAYHEEVEEDARGRISTLLGDADGWDVELRADWVVRVLPAVVREKGIDLVVIAGVSQTGLAGVLLGTTAEKVLKRLPCSALVLKPEGWTSPIA